MPETVRGNTYLLVLHSDSKNLAKFQNVVREVFVFYQDYC